MAEPISAGAVGVAAACAYQAGVVMIDPVFGMPLDAVIVGCIAGIAAQIHIQPRDGATRTKTAVFIYALFGSFFAGILAPLVASAAIDNGVCLPGITSQGMRLAAAAIVGALIHVVPVVGPDLYKRAASRWIGSTND